MGETLTNFEDCFKWANLNAASNTQWDTIKINAPSDVSSMNADDCGNWCNGYVRDTISTDIGNNELNIFTTCEPLDLTVKAYYGRPMPEPRYKLKYR